ncbi:ntpase, DNA primase [Pteropox virus]|uniref:Ntpase, DNA primase n=1 Tax=Pteropox virus TaxID=1873698 RepID=A0A1B1MRL9_9POXV|nr:ntpase, DNA primase [Pteropox virus]ANS71170.1 ntpase, DNA primase [Pteropox virus]
MATQVENNIIFVLKKLAVTKSCRESEDERYVEAFTCEELEAYIKQHPTCSLFETLRNEEEFSVVRLFLDIDVSYPMDEQEYVLALKELITAYTKFVTSFVSVHCSVKNTDKIKKCMMTNFSITLSNDTDKTSSHIIFLDVYTTMDTLIAMKKPLLKFIKSSENPLIRSIDPAIYRKSTTLRVVDTRKTKTNNYVHQRRPPHTKISDYLFTYVEMSEKTCYFTIDAEKTDNAAIEKIWEPNFISFSDAMKRVKKAIVNEIVNIDEITDSNFVSVPLIIDYVSPCAICKKKSHKHTHHLSVRDDTLRIYKSGNPYSCKVKVISLEGNRLFSAAQHIFNANVVQMNERGDHIVWLKNSWRYNDESLLTKLILSMRDNLLEYNIDILCPRKRKIIESNLRDMIVDTVETDLYFDKLPFNNGVLDIATNKFYTGEQAKPFMCTVSTGYNFKEDVIKCTDQVKEVQKELYSIIDDIQPKTAENLENREIYERVLSSCLCGMTKQCLVFFYGETATGKSTTKKLLKSVVGSMFVETGQTILTDVMDKGPNPFVASMHLKRAVFCSELPDFACNGAKRIRADNIKKLTEPCIVGRLCFSNKINNKNHATIIIDTNYKPVFDRVDNALMRRIILVKFRTHFSTVAGRKAAENNSSYDKVKLLDEELETKIHQNYFRTAFLNILIGWYQKYHCPILKLEPTPHAVPDFAFHIKVNSLIIASAMSHMVHIEHFAKLGYSILDGEIGLTASLFQQRLGKHFNSKISIHDIESFVNRNKKFNSIGEEYVAFIFIEDLPNK